jgi:hypothetical protein
MQLFTRLGLDTGFNDITSHIYPNCNAGMEWDIRDANSPYLVKNPCLCDYLEPVLESGDVVIDHAIVPVRDQFSAAESRRDVVRRADPALHARPEEIPGGLWNTSDPANQEAVLAEELYKLVHVLTKYDIPTTLLYFPRLVRDSKYLYDKIKFLLADMDGGFFSSAFKEVSRPDLVHNFCSTQGSRIGE